MGKCQVQLADRVFGAGRQVGEGGDLTGQAAQIGCVVAGPGGDGVVGGDANPTASAEVAAPQPADE
ncbi:hypothetical protein [Streptomyces sp. NPDC054958]